MYLHKYNESIMFILNGYIDNLIVNAIDQSPNIYLYIYIIRKNYVLIWEHFKEKRKKRRDDNYWIAKHPCAF